MIRQLRWALGHWLTRDEPPHPHTVIVEVDGRTIARALVR